MVPNKPIENVSKNEPFSEDFSIFLSWTSPQMQMLWCLPSIKLYTTSQIWTGFLANAFKIAFLEPLFQTKSISSFLNKEKTSNKHPILTILSTLQGSLQRERRRELHQEGRPQPAPHHREGRRYRGPRWANKHTFDSIRHMPLYIYIGFIAFDFKTDVSFKCLRHVHFQYLWIKNEEWRM